jgi:hypothetical protein
VLYHSQKKEPLDLIIYFGVPLQKVIMENRCQ